MTDYLVDPGTAALFGGNRTSKLTAWCLQTGLLTTVDVGGVQHLRIIDDPEFIHIRTRAEVEWDRRRQADAGNLGLVVPVRLRDGDQCRYCGVMVMWTGKKSRRSAEYDHRRAGEPARTPDDLVVACRSCNGARQDNPAWDDAHPIRPVPTHPLYREQTARFLTLNGHPTTANADHPDATTASSADPAPHWERPAAQPTAHQVAASPVDRPAETPGPPPAWATGNASETAGNPTYVTDPGSGETGLSGSGRDGSGPVRPGQGQDGPGPGTAPRKRRRGRRGGRPAEPTTTEGGTAR